MAVITITLNKIRAHSPCESGWKTLLKAKAGVGMDAEFPLSDVLDSNDLADTLWCLRCLPEHDNLWRLYAVWCARQVQHLMKDQRSIDALDVAGRHARGLATDAELDAARAAARDAARNAAWDAAWNAELAASRAASWANAGDAARAAARAAAREAAGEAARAAQAQKLREILNRGEW